VIYIYMADPPGAAAAAVRDYLLSEDARPVIESTDVTPIEAAGAAVPLPLAMAPS
jgi:hypothetical protein